MSSLIYLENDMKTVKPVLLAALLVLFTCGIAFGSDSSASNVTLTGLSMSDLSQSHSQSGAVSIVDTKSESKTIDGKSSQSKTSSAEANNTVTVTKIIPKKSSHEVSGVQESVVPSSDNVAESRRLNPEALMRGFFVFAGLSILVLVYIAWKSFGKKPAQIHKYGVVADEDLEMARLDSDDGEGDEDDTTHFDVSKHRLK